MLTSETYFTDANESISNSKVSDWLRSKEYYFRRHVERSLAFKKSDNVKVGSLVDALLTGDKLPYQVKVLKRDDADLFELQKEADPDSFVPESVMVEAEARAKSIMREPFFQEYIERDAQFQVILEGNILGDPAKAGVPTTIPVCGVADVISYDKETDTYYIDDFKCTSKMKCNTPQKWAWNCHEMGYFRQLAVYTQLLAGSLEKPPKNIICRHVVSYPEHADVYKVNLYEIPMDILPPYWKEFTDAVKAIKKEKLWRDDPVTWDKAIKLPYGNANGNLSDDDIESDSGEEPETAPAGEY